MSKQLLSLLLVAGIPMNSMELQLPKRERSDSILIEIAPGSPEAIDYARRKHPLAYKIVKRAMNGNSDAYLVQTIGKSLDKDRNTILYNELRKTRKVIQDLTNLKKKKINRDEATDYIFKELSEKIAQKKFDGKSQRRQKIIIAICGVASTIITGVSTALASYFAK